MASTGYYIAFYGSGISLAATATANMCPSCWLLLLFGPEKRQELGEDVHYQRNTGGEKRKEREETRERDATELRKGIHPSGYEKFQ